MTVHLSYSLDEEMFWYLLTLIGKEDPDLAFWLAVDHQLKD